MGRRAGVARRPSTMATSLVSAVVHIVQNNTEPSLLAHPLADRCDLVPHSSPGHLQNRAHFAMGTRFNVYLDCPEEAEADACFRAVIEEIDRLEDTFSRFRPGSELSRLNRHASDGPITTDPEVFQLLAFATDVSRKTDGAFDITAGRLTRAWKSAAKSSLPIDANDWAQLCASAGWKNLQLDPAARTVQFAHRELELDLGAIAKGYAVDCAIDLLESLQVAGIIDAGSSSIAATRDAAEWRWTVDISHPFNPSLTIAQVALAECALSTSGVREQSFTHDGRIYSHLIDLTAQEPFLAERSPQVLQVTVLAPTSTLADALSTAVFLLGPERGCAALEHFEDCSALWILQEGENIVCRGHRWPEQVAIQERCMHGQT